MQAVLIRLRTVASGEQCVQHAVKVRSLSISFQKTFPQQEKGNMAFKHTMDMKAILRSTSVWAVHFFPMGTIGIFAAALIQ